MGVLPSMAPDMVVTTADTAECMITTTGQDTMMFRLATECMPPASTRTPLALEGGIGMIILMLMADTAWDTVDTAEDMADTAWAMADTAWDTEDTAEDILDTADTVDTVDTAWDMAEVCTADTADTAWGDMAWDTDTVEWDTADTADTAWDTELLTKQ